jgi:protein gp37
MCYDDPGHGHGSPFLVCDQVNKIRWVIVGGESGPGARPMHPDWVRGIRDQCQAAGVAFFFKQWGEWVPSDQYPPELNGIRLSRYKRHTFEDVHQHMFHVGKKSAGRILDGRMWDEIPIVY